MFIELVDMLRCPVSHDETWLVATIERMDERTIVDGMLGCPICHAEYPVRAGVVYFAPEHIAPPTATPAEPNEAMRVAAGLSLTEPHMVALLQGRWCAHAHLVRSLSPSRLLLLNPPRDVALDDGISAIVSHVVPLRAASVGAIAFDESATPPIVDGLLRSLRPGGRVLCPVAIDPPDAVTLLTRDEDIWIGTRAGAEPSIVSLGRRDRGRGGAHSG